MEKRLGSILIAFMMVLTLMPQISFAESDAAIIENGELKNGVTWELDSTGVLTVKGTGSMVNFDGPSFRNLDKVTSVIIEDGITSIHGFENCINLANITIPDSVTAILSDAFKSCHALQSITIPDSVTQIGDGAFSNCTRLSSINIPEGITAIKYDTFYHCRKLSLITLPDTLTKIGSNAFEGCESLSSITIPDSVTDISESAFNGCASLTKIVIPPSLTQDITRDTFAGCENLTIYGDPGSKAHAHAVKYEIPFSCITHGDIITLPEKAATCTTDGLTAGSKCSVCGTVIVEQEIMPAKKHNYSAYETTTKAGFGKTGIQTAKCRNSGCKSTKTKVIPALKTPVLSTTTYTYNGKEKKPAVTVKNTDGTSISKTVTYASGRKNAGKYSVKVTVNTSDYKDTKTVYFTIKPVKITSMSLSASSFTYNGKEKKPTVTVKAGTKTIAGKTSKDNNNIDITYASGRKNVGTYKVTVKGKGNYTGTLYKTFKINPKGATNVKLARGKKQFKVTWSKPTTSYRKQITGYQVRYATTASKLKSVKPVTVKGSAVTGETVKNLSSKKTYYVQVRTYKTVKGVNYYSDWSTKKSIKTK